MTPTPELTQGYQRKGLRPEMTASGVNAAQQAARH